MQNISLAIKMAFKKIRNVRLSNIPSSDGLCEPPYSEEVYLSVPDVGGKQQQKDIMDNNYPLLKAE